MSQPFHIVSDYEPQGDQPNAIAALCEGLSEHRRDQVLLGVTGSGKTFTMAKVIEQTQRPALILAHNKTLAAQLYSEFKRFLPHNAVEYFVSYYDYYQPEAYVAKTDTFIEKDSAINEQIDRLRHSATRSLLEREDVVVVASVSCIYGIGSVETYSQMTLELHQSQQLNPQQFIYQLTELQYERNDIGFVRGTFRVRGDNIDLFPAHLEDRAWRFNFFGDELETISEFDPLTGEPCGKMASVVIYAKSHYVTPKPTIEQAIRAIKEELKERLEWLYANNRLLEAQRLDQRTSYDLEMLVETGMCKGIENYSRYLSGTKAGDPPPTLFQYLPQNALLFVDESHVMLPQLRAMYNGDKARKSVLSEYGFRLPSCMDNRPLKFEEWDAMRPETIYVSATPSAMELERSAGHVIEQVIRPTGLIDPPTIIRPVATQVDDLIGECQAVVAGGMRIMVTTLTKKMAEQLTEYLNDVNVKTRYLHSDIDTLERVEILRDLRLGVYDVLVGVNLLREGLDIPECGLMAILDADKEGFLRSKTSLIQTIGRAARNDKARVILYADKITESMRAAIEETDRRRAIQQAHNTKYGIVPHTVIKAIGDDLRRDDAIGDAAAQAEAEASKSGKLKASALKGDKLEQHLLRLRQQMLEAAANLEFEQAARLRDDIEKLKKTAA